MSHEATTVKLTQVLRIGIVRDDRIAGEHVFKAHEAVRLGIDQPLGCPDMDRPDWLRGYSLFKYSGGKYFLLLTKDMVFKGMPPQGTIEHPFALPLTPSSKGKVTIGKTSYLFMFVGRLPEQQRPR